MDDNMDMMLGDAPDFFHQQGCVQDNSLAVLNTTAAGQASAQYASSTMQSLAGAADNYSAESMARMQQAVILHPLYPRLLEAIISCRKVGQDSKEELQELDQRLRRAKMEAAAARDTCFQQHGALPAEVHDPDLHEYMTRYVAAAEQHKAQLAALYQDVEAAARSMDGQISQLLSGGHGPSGGGSRASELSSPTAALGIGHPAFSGAASHDSSASHSRGDTSGSATSSRNEQTEALRSMLKRQYADTISQLQEEFTRKKARAKLPDDATAILRTWWDANFTWPYPMDDDKAALSQETGLSTTQVNNWFINQRKRHWHKLFAGAQPSNESEAAAMLRAAGYI